jgi:O-antigen/teichoic acid export membrane protein
METKSFPDSRSTASSIGRGSFVNFVGLGLGNALQFGMVLALARGLSQNQAGWFLASYAGARVVAVAGSWGLSYTVLRFGARDALVDVAALRHTVQRCTTYAAIASVIATACVVVGALVFLPSVESGPQRLAFLGIMLSAPLMSVESVIVAATKATGDMARFALVDQVLDSALKTSGIVAALALGVGVVGCGVAFTLASLGTLCAAVWVARDLLFGLGDGHGRGRRELISYTMFQWGADMANVGLLWLDTLLVGAWKGAADVAVYSLDTRVIQFGMLFAMPMTIAVQPHIGRLLQAQAFSALRETYRATTAALTVLAVPPLVATGILAPGILNLAYGHRYLPGATALAVLAVGQVVNTTTGPCGHIVAMSGRSDLVLANSIVALTTNVVLNVLLIPKFGYTGAAVAWTVALAVWNIMRLLQARRITGIFPYDRHVRFAGLAICAFSGGGFIARYSLGVDTARGAAATLGVLVVMYVPLALFELAKWRRVLATP